MPLRFSSFWGGIGLFYYYSSPEWLAMTGFSFFAKRAGWRFVIKLLAVFVVACIPLSLREKGNVWKGRTGQAMKSFIDSAVELWKESPWPVRLPLSIVYALGCGVLVFLMLFVPIKWFPASLTRQLRRVVVPALMRGAAARGVELNLPKIWSKVPLFIRSPIDIGYSWLYENTFARAERAGFLTKEKILEFRTERRKRKEEKKKAEANQPKRVRRMNFHV